MKISSSRLENYFSKKIDSKKTSNINYTDTPNKTTNFKGTVYQSCYVQNQVTEEDIFFENFLKKKGKVSKEEYLDIVQNHPRTLARSYEMCQKAQNNIGTTLNTMAKTAINLKNYYDSLYDNYTVISVGKSPAPFAEALQNLGSKVIFLPSSGLMHLYDVLEKEEKEEKIEGTIAENIPNIKLAMDYATHKGIADKDAGEIIILDYSATGKSLEIMERIIKERGDIPEDKIHVHSLMTDIYKSLDEENSIFIMDRTLGKVLFDLAMMNTKPMCNVPRLNCLEDSIGDVENEQEYERKENIEFQKFDDYSTPLGRAWSLCTTHEAMKLQE